MEHTYVQAGRASVDTAMSLADADRVLIARPTQDGDGVNIRRIAGAAYNALLDPFLMLDELDADREADYIGGFPPHPHRGFQTLTYMKEGAFRHRDSMGNEGLVRAGGLQWMSAASGVIHSEMPEAVQGRMHGFQLWLNLPRSEKMRAPDYRDVQGEEVLHQEINPGVTAHVPVGMLQVGGVELRGPLTLPESDALLVDLALASSGRVLLSLQAGFQYNLYLYEGQSRSGLSKGQMAHFSAREQGRTLLLEAAETGMQLLILGGRPLREPIAQYGPFVMNTMEEVEQALRDYRDNRLVLR